MQLNELNSTNELVEEIYKRCSAQDKPLVIVCDNEGDAIVAVTGTMSSVNNLLASFICAEADNRDMDVKDIITDLVLKVQHLEKLSS